MAFNPNEHLTGLPRQQKQSNGTYITVKDDYLEVKWRLVWFREQCPQGVILTEEIFVDLDRVVEADATRWVPDPKREGKNMKETYTKQAKGYARYKATVKDGKGGEATGTKSESAVDFPDFIEKAETGAIGRALAALGFGTQFTGDEFNEEHRIVDSPVRTEASDDPAPTTNAVHPAQAAMPTQVANKSTKQSNAQSTSTVRSQTKNKPAEEQPKPVSLAALQKMADRYYPGAWQSVRSTLVAKFNIFTEITDEQLASEYNNDARNLIVPHVPRQSSQPATASSGK